MFARFLSLTLVLSTFVQMECAWKDVVDGVRWDFACDFLTTDIGNVRCPGEQCGAMCLGNPLCDSFTWSPYEGGTCWLKTGCSLQSTLKTNEVGSNLVCGYIPNRCQTGSDWELVDGQHCDL